MIISHTQLLIYDLLGRELPDPVKRIYPDVQDAFAEIILSF